MHTAVLPSSLLSMKSYTLWAPTIDQYAFQSSFRCPLDSMIAFRLQKDITIDQAEWDFIVRPINSTYKLGRSR